MYFMRKSFQNILPGGSVNTVKTGGPLNKAKSLDLHFELAVHSKLWQHMDMKVDHIGYVESVFYFFLKNCLV